jgi:L-ribulokinase
VHRHACDCLYDEYITLHGYFGRGDNDLMKRLKTLKSDVLAGK